MSSLQPSASVTCVAGALALALGLLPAAADAQAANVHSPYVQSVPLNQPRRGHTITALADHRVAIIGGTNQENPVAEIEVLDPAAGTIKVAGKLQVPRFDHDATLLPDGRVMITGGAGENGPLDSTEIFDPATGVLTEGPKLNRARAGHTATLLEDGRILVAGGRSEDSAELFDPGTGRFALLGAKLGAARGLHRAISLRNGSVLLVGGVDADGSPLDTAEIFRLARLSFTSTDMWMQARRVHPELILLPNGKVQVLGGDKDRSMEVYDPEGRYFRGYARLLPTFDVVPGMKILASVTRSCLVDAAAPDVTGGRVRLPGGDTREFERFGTAVASLLPPPVPQPAPDAHDFSMQVSSDAHAQDGTPVPLVFAGRRFDADYVSTTIPGRGLAVLSAAARDEVSLLQSVLVLSASDASVTSDRVDYAPDGRPAIQGAGWKPGEKIRLVRQSVRTNERLALEAQADNLGRFTFSGFTPASHQVGSYVITAYGESSGSVAQTSYTSSPRLITQPATGPFRFSIPDVPLSGETAGSLATPAGTMQWSLTVPPASGAHRSGTHGKAPGSVAHPGSGDLMSHATGFSFNPPDVSFNPGCFSLPPGSTAITMCPSGTAHLDGSMSVDGSFDAGALPNPACCACEILPDVDCSGVCTFSCSGRLPSLSASFDMNTDFSTSFSSDFTLDGSIVNSDKIRIVDFRQFDAGFPAVTIDGQPVPGTSDDATFGIHLALSLLAGVNLKVADPMKFHTDLGFNLNNVDLSVGASTSSGFTENASGSGSATAGFKLAQLGSTTLTLSLGIGATGKIQLKDTCDPLMSATIRPVAAFIDGTFQSSNPNGSCQRYNLSSDWGFQTDGTVNAGCGVLTIQPAKFEVDIFKAPIASLNTGLFRDTGAPNIACPANIVLPTTAGKCSAPATYSVTASDDCSGLKPGFSPSVSAASGSTFNLGTTTVTALAKDNADTADFPAGPNPNSATCQFTVTVQDKENPVLAPIADILNKPSDPGKCGALVSFNLSATDNCPNVQVSSGPNPPGSFFPVGTTTVTATATDGSKNAVSQTFKVGVIDVEKPVIQAVSASPSTLWPPNHKLVPVTINYTPLDNCSIQSCKLSVVSSELLSDPSDVQVVDSHHLLLATDRLGSGPGRTYTTTITCTDPTGNSTSSQTVVTVPHDQGK
jgi:hypothetical protein